MQGRRRSAGRLVLQITPESVVFECAGKHQWGLTVDEIRTVGKRAETCPTCGRVAVDAQLGDVTKRIERRGEVIELFSEPDA